MSRPLPAAVYWRRRLLALAALILVVFLAVQLWPSGGGDAPPPRAAPTTTATPDPDGEVTVRLPSSQTACQPEQTRIVPSVPEDQRSGGAVEIDLSISSTTDQACALTLKADDLLVVVSAGSTGVYDSSLCSARLVDEPVALSPGWSTVVPVRWSGRGTGRDCNPREGYASPGSYVVEAGTLGGEPGRARFSLGQPKPKPKATKTPTKSPSATPTKSPSATPTPADSPSPSASRD